LLRRPLIGGIALALESDNLIYVRKVSATDAARRFSDVLDAVEGSRESFIVVRRGREVATISPASPAGGKRLKAVIARHRPDAAWSRELAELRSKLIDEPAAWHD